MPACEVRSSRAFLSLLQRDAFFVRMRCVYDVHAVRIRSPFHAGRDRRSECLQVGRRQRL